MIVVGNGIYEKCCNCGSLVKINKWLFGSMHICLNEEELRLKRQAQQMIRHQTEYKPRPLGEQQPNNLGEKK